MSEAELHVLRARLRGGILNKARRGELEMRLPIGFVYDAQRRVRLDPDARIQDSVRQLFRSFRRTGSATATVKAFREQGLAFPRRLYRGPRKGEVVWAELEHSRVLWVLHHPRYAGAFCFGRSRQRQHPDGHPIFVRLPPEEWTALIHDAHEAYITWEELEQNLQRLRENAHAQGADRERGAPREGPALLQGLAVCARCGERMTVRYHLQGERRVPDYMCQRQGIERAQPVCQQIHGQALDEAVGRLLVETVTPLTLQVALEVQQELENRSEECDRLRRREVERARYESDLARRRYCRSTLTTAWSRTRWKPNGTRRCARSRRPRNATNSTSKPIEPGSTSNSVPASWRWPRTFLGYGTTRIHPSASANVWRGYSSPT